MIAHFSVKLLKFVRIQHAPILFYIYIVYLKFVWTDNQEFRSLAKYKNCRIANLGPFKGEAKFLKY